MFMIQTPQIVYIMFVYNALIDSHDTRQSVNFYGEKEAQ